MAHCAECGGELYEGEGITENNYLFCTNSCLRSFSARPVKNPVAPLMTHLTTRRATMYQDIGGVFAALHRGGVYPIYNSDTDLITVWTNYTREHEICQIKHVGNDHFNVTVNGQLKYEKVTRQNAIAIARHNGELPEPVQEFGSFNPEPMVPKTQPLSEQLGSTESSQKTYHSRDKITGTVKTKKNINLDDVMADEE